MVILIDTNIIIDFLAKREPFYNNAEKVMRHCLDKKLVGYMATYTIPTVFYILRKRFLISEIRTMLFKLCNFLEIVEIDKKHILEAIRNESFKDFEDCLQMECAVSIGADYIVTRNIDDFSGSTIPAILPEDFLVKLEAAR